MREYENQVQLSFKGRLDFTFSCRSLDWDWHRNAFNNFVVELRVCFQLNRVILESVYAYGVTAYSDQVGICNIFGRCEVAPEGLGERCRVLDGGVVKETH